MDDFEVYEKSKSLGVTAAPLAQEFENLLSEINYVRCFGCSITDMKDDLKEVISITDKLLGSLSVVKKETEKILGSIG